MIGSLLIPSWSAQARSVSVRYRKSGPFTCLGTFLFIDYNCLLCYSLTSVNTPFAWWAPSFQTVLILSSWQASCRTRHYSLLGSHHRQNRPGLPREAPGWPWTLAGGTSHPGVFRGLLIDPGAPGCPRGRPGWSECGHVAVPGVARRTLRLAATLVNPRAPPGATPAFTMSGFR